MISSKRISLSFFLKLLCFNLLSLSSSNEEEVIITLFMHEIHNYCVEYDPSPRNWVLSNLMVSPQIIIGNDIQGEQFEGEEAFYYYHRIKDNNVVIRYESKFQIQDFYRNGQRIRGAILSKTLIHRDTVIQTQELVGLTNYNGDLKIEFVSSSLFKGDLKLFYGAQIIQVETESQENGENLRELEIAPIETCYALVRANEHLKARELELALEHFKDAQICRKSENTLVRFHIDSIAQMISIDSSIVARTGADSFLVLKNYSQALLRYNLALSTKSLYKELERRIFEKIRICRNEVQFSGYLEDANKLSSKGHYLKAIEALEEALNIKPNDIHVNELMDQTNSLNAYDRSVKIQEDVSKAIFLIEEKKKFDQGLLILMKYQDSGILDFKSLFYMAQIMDTCPRKVKRLHNMNSSDCCLHTYKYLITIKNMNISNNEFDYFWNDHLSQKSKSCF